MIKIINDLTLDEFVEKGNSCLFFYSADFMPCNRMFDLISKIQIKFSNVKFGMIDIDACIEAEAEFNVVSVPTLILVKDGKKIEKIEGMLREKILIEKIESLRKTK